MADLVCSPEQSSGLAWALLDDHSGGKPCFMMPTFKVLAICLPVISKLIISFYFDISLSSVGTFLRETLPLAIHLPCVSSLVLGKTVMHWAGKEGSLLGAYWAWHFFNFSSSESAAAARNNLGMLSFFPPFLDIRNFLFLLKIGFDNVLRGLTNTREKAERKVESCPMELPCRELGHCHLGEHGQREWEARPPLRRSVVEGEQKLMFI